MKKHSLTIHGLKNHSPAQRGRLVEYLAERFQLSPDLIAIKLKSFPVTFKDWVDDEDLPAVKIELEELGVLAAFDEGEKIAAAAASRDSEPEAEPAAPQLPPESAAPAVDESEAAAEEADDTDDGFGELDLSFDDEAKDLAALKKEEVAGDSKRLEVPQDLDLSFHQGVKAPLAGGAAAAPPAAAATEPAVEPPKAKPSSSAISFSDQQTSTPSRSTLLSDDELDSLLGVGSEDEPETEPDAAPQSASASVAEAAPPSAAADDGTGEPPISAAGLAASAGQPAPDTAPEDEEDYLDDEFEDEFEDEYYTPLLSQPTLWVLACALIVAAAIASFTFGGGADTTPQVTITGETAARLLNEQKAILVVKKPVTPGLTSKHKRVWSGSLEEEGIKTDITVTAHKGNLIDMQLDISTPPPAKLTPKEIVAGVAQPVWLNRFEISRLEHYETFDVNDPGKAKYPIEKFSLRTKGKAYMRDHAGRGRRIVAPILIEGELAEDESTIKGTWTIANGAPGEPALPENSAKFLGGKAYRLFYSSPFRAKLIESNEGADESEAPAAEEQNDAAPDSAAEESKKTS